MSEFASGSNILTGRVLCSEVELGGEIVGSKRILKLGPSNMQGKPPKKNSYDRPPQKRMAEHSEQEGEEKGVDVTRCPLWTSLERCDVQPLVA